MECSNHTPFPALFLPGSTGDGEMIGIVVCKVTFLVDGDSLRPIAGEDAWPVFDKPFFFRNVMLAPEADFRKQGVDCLVFGNAVAPEGKAVPYMRVAVDCGRLHHEAAVIGDRVWKKKLVGFVPSDPEPFVEMPLTNDRAFGGATKLADAMVQHPINPDGRGFVFLKDAVENTPLPNLENVDHLIEKWEDKPRPTCFFKPVGVLPPKDAPPSSGKGGTPAAALSFNDAPPDLVVDPGDLGDSMRLTGFSRHGDIVLPMPAVHGPVAHVRVGHFKSVFRSTLSTVMVLAPERIVVASYRCLFRYLFRPLEKRHTDLEWPDGPKPGQAYRKGARHA
jgi:hypothetical protein